jgi:hypothetical protein
MRLNAGLPVWHVSVSAWSGEKMSSQPKVCEREAVKLLRGVGGDREWWFWNPAALVGHLRVAVTEAEHDQMPCGVAENDAGEAGPERRRTR